MGRRTLLAAMALVVAFDAGAQAKSQRLPRVGYCGGFGDRTHAFHKAFVEGMRKRGWIDGANVQIVIPEGTIVEGIVRKSCTDYMADKSLDVIVDGGRPDDPSYKVPMVAGRGGVMGTPLATSPTRNVTGLTTEKEDAIVRDKMMALLKEATGAENIFFLYAMPPGPEVKAGIGNPEILPPHIREAAQKLGVKVIPVVFTTLEDYEPAFRVIAATPRSAAIFHQGMYWYKVRSGHLGVDWYIHKHRLPVMFPAPDWVQATDTIMIAYGRSMIEAAERKSYFVDRILRGARPADLPFEQIPYRLGINVEAAKLYGIDVPRSVLLQADIVVPPDPRFEWGKAPQGQAGLEP